MTGVTVQSLMGTVEFVIGLGVVVEAPQPPAIGVVAQSTVVTKPHLVGVIGLVT